MKFNFSNIKNKLKSTKFLTKKNIIISVVILAIGAGAVNMMGKGKKVEGKQEVKNVKVQKIFTGSIANDVQYPSKLTPVQEVTVFPKTPGKVATLNVEVGDKVTAGQVLFTLDTAELQAQLQSQQANLQAAEANLEKTSDSSLAQQINQAEQTVGKSSITYENAKNNYEKLQKLYSAGAIAKKELDDSKVQYDTAQVDLSTAQQNLSILRDKVGPQSTRAAAAQVTQAQAGVSSSQVQINNASITTPIAGVVSAKDVKVGQLAGGQTGSVTIIDSSSFFAEVNVPDKIVGKIQAGQSVDVTITALDNKKVSGVVDKISPNTNSKDNSYTVKVKIDNSNGELKAGMFTKVSLPSEKKDNILTVPNEAVKMENNVNYLYIVENGTVKKLSIDIGLSDNKFTEVSGKIREGANVIIEGQNLLSNGEKVNIVN